MPSEKLPLRPPVVGPDAARYRINYLNPNGTILRTKPIEASNDAEAIEHARQLMDGRALDLWDGLRFIEFFPTLDEA